MPHDQNSACEAESGLYILKVRKSCLTLCDSTDCSPPGSPVHGILQARTLEWVGIFCLQGIFLTQGSNLGLPHCRQILYSLSHQGSRRSRYPDTKLILRDRVLGEVQKKSFIALLGRVGPQRANTLKIVCPNLEGVVRSFITMAQTEGDQLVDILLNGWWWGKWESASSTLWLQLVWGLHTGGQPLLTSSTWWD